MITEMLKQKTTYFVAQLLLQMYAILVRLYAFKDSSICRTERFFKPIEHLYFTLRRC